MSRTSLSSFVAFIDESGDEGFSFHKGSSQWFILSGVVLRCSEEQAEVKLIDNVRDAINRHRSHNNLIPPKKALHFRDLKHEERRYFATHIASAKLKTITIMVHKSNLTSPENFTKDSRLYFYAVRLLIERLSWYCRDHLHKEDAGDGSVEIIFSNRSGMNYEKLKNYLAHLELNRNSQEFSAAPGIIRSSQVSSCTHGRRLGLQIADAIASSHYYAVEPSQYGLPDDNYARLLQPVMYRYKGSVWGYGIKIMPRETEELRRNGIIFSEWK